MNFIKKLTDNHLELILSGFFLVLILFSKFAAPYIFLMAITILLNYKWKTITFQLNKFSLWFAIFYLVYVIGMIWTQDAEQAMRYLENKVAFLIFPFLFSFKKNSGFNIRIIYFGLIIATLSALLYGIFVGIPCYIRYASFPYCFMKSHLSPFMHPSYMSVFVMLSIVVCYKMILAKSIHKTVGWLIIFILILYTVLLLSLAGLMSLIVLLVAYCFYVLKKRFSNLVFVAGILIAGILLWFFVNYTPFLKDDIKQTIETTKTYSNSPSQFVQNLPESPASAEVRLVMWSVTLEEIRKHPFGVGTGNVDLYLGSNLRQKGNPDFADKAYNPHNQFLQTQLEIGVVGLLILLIIVFGGIIKGVKMKNWIILILFLSLLLNSLFESMLQLQAGILFYLFFFMVLMINIRSEVNLQE